MSESTQRNRSKNNFIMLTLPDKTMQYIREQAEKEDRPLTYIARRMVHQSPEFQLLHAPKAKQHK